MAEIITIVSFPSFNIMQETELTDNVAEGAVSLPVLDEEGFDTDHVVCVGTPGAESSEIITPSAVADEAITVPALDKAHKKGDKVFMIRANKAKVYAAPNVDGSRPVTDTYVLLGTVTFTGEQEEKEYSHDTGGSDYWYLYTYLNDIPATEEETDKILTDAIRGGGYGRYATVDEVRDEAGLNSNRWIKDALIYSKLIMAESEVNSSIVLAGYTLPLSTVPENIKNATILLAAGYVLTKDYGSGHSGLSKDGNAKIAQARAILAKIESGVTPILDEDGGKVATGTSVAGYPDDTAEDESPSEERMFSVTDQF